jgi:hypothetical protein
VIDTHVHHHRMYITSDFVEAHESDRGDLKPNASQHHARRGSSNGRAHRENDCLDYLSTMNTGSETIMMIMMDPYLSASESPHHHHLEDGASTSDSFSRAAGSRKRAKFLEKEVENFRATNP